MAINVPIKWSISKGEDLFTVIRGVTYKKQNLLSENSSNAIAVLRAGNLQNNRILFDDIVLVPNKLVKEIQKLRKGDLIVAMSSGSVSIVGKVACVDKDYCNFSFGAFCGLIRPCNINFSNWLKYYFQTKTYRNYISNLATGVNINNLRPSYLLELTIPLPPLNEQKRIVTKIEALQTRSTAVKEELKAIKPLLNQFRQSVLAAAFRGDLTKDWREQNPDVEPAEVLLERIRVERRRRWEEAELEKMKVKGKIPKDDSWKKKYKEPQPIDLKTDYLPDLPDKWLWLSADQCTYLITDGEHATPKRSDSGVYLLSARNILDGKISFEKVDFVPEDVYKKLEQRLKLEAGDVLLSCSGTVGRSCVAPLDLRCAFVRSVAILKTVFKTGEYISLAIRSPVLQMQIEQKKTQTAQSNIFQGRIKILAIPYAPLEEQQEIVRRIESLFKLADNIEQQYQQAEADLKTLNQSILAKAFRGELVPQDPNDEPASVLLERIREERDTDKPKKSKIEKKRSSKKQDKQLEIPGI